MGECGAGAGKEVRTFNNGRQGLDRRSQTSVEFFEIFGNFRSLSRISRRQHSFEPRLNSTMSVCLRHTRRIAPPAMFYAASNVNRFFPVAVRSYSSPADSRDDSIDDSFIPAPIDRSYETPDVTRARLYTSLVKEGFLKLIWCFQPLQTGFFRQCHLRN
jgi:hypothetical protein